MSARKSTRLGLCPSCGLWWIEHCAITDVVNCHCDNSCVDCYYCLDCDTTAHPGEPCREKGQPPRFFRYVGIAEEATSYSYPPPPPIKEEKVMTPITVKTADLLKKVQGFRKEHIAEVERLQELTTANLDAAIAKAREATASAGSSYGAESEWIGVGRLRGPIDVTHHYDKLVTRLEMETETTLVFGDEEAQAEFNAMVGNTHPWLVDVSRRAEIIEEQAEQRVSNTTA